MTTTKYLIVLSIILSSNLAFADVFFGDISSQVITVDFKKDKKYTNKSIYKEYRSRKKKCNEDFAFDIDSSNTRESLSVRQVLCKDSGDIKETIIFQVNSSDKNFYLDKVKFEVYSGPHLIRKSKHTLTKPTPVKTYSLTEKDLGKIKFEAYKGIEDYYKYTDIKR